MNNHFKRRYDGPRLSPAEADRQGRISKLALAALRQPDAIAFLNTHDEELGGRPLDLAIKSEDGFAMVEHALAARSSKA